MPAAATESSPDFDARNRARKAVLTQQWQMWRRRSGLIRLLRLALPGLIGLILVLIVGWIGIQSLLNALNVYNPASQDVRMTNLHLIDQTRAGDPYEVSGLEAIKKVGATSISLKAPVMVMKGDKSHPSHLQAVSGLYDDTTKTFEVNGHVVFTGGASGVTMRTDRARVNLNTSVVSGDHQVEAQWDRGLIHGESFIIYDNGNRVLINGTPSRRVCGVLNAAPKSQTPGAVPAIHPEENPLCLPPVK